MAKDGNWNEMEKFGAWQLGTMKRHTTPAVSLFSPFSFSSFLPFSLSFLFFLLFSLNLSLRSVINSADM
ncbi:hypothetical protein VNO80_18237 [Phaseolus coccineus]|uniref:Transmembrane protein n=1 Tax=Phaseolus coccineus TaxID=3886 RepID=A0AAN9MK01_PHACN